MDKKHRLLKKYIKNSKNILIISHLGPDPDAFCSMLLLKEAIKQIYPKKIVNVKAKQMPNFNIPTMHDIEVVERLEIGDEDFIIVVDIPSFSLCINEDDPLKDTTVPIMIIDHHPEGKQSNLDISINESRSSGAEQVYVTIKRIFGNRLKITKEMAEIAQYGIVADTNRFMYEVTTNETFNIFAELRSVSPINLEVFNYNNKKFPYEAIPFIQDLLKNLKIEGDMVYTYIDRGEDYNKTAVNQANKFVKDYMLLYIQGGHWGFIIKPKQKENEWRVSFRSINGYQKVKKMAESLGGGGHNGSSAGNIKAKSAQEATEKVLEVVHKLKD